MKLTLPSLRRTPAASRSNPVRRKTGKTGPKTGPKTGSADTSVLAGSTTATSQSVDTGLGTRSLIDSEWQINLLPYRAVRRHESNRRFLMCLVASAALGALVVAASHLMMVERLDVQGRRNDYLTQQISVLEKQIADIKGLKDEIEATLSRKRAVETLQANRSLAVQVLNQLLNPPEGINYKSIKEAGDTLTIDGMAGSNAQISQFMTQLEHASPLKSPRLVEIHAIQDTSVTPSRRMNEFTLVVDVQDLAKLAEERDQASKMSAKNRRTALATGATTDNTPPASSPTAASSVALTREALTPRQVQGAQVTVDGPLPAASVPVALPPSAPLRPTAPLLPALPPITAPDTASAPIRPAPAR